MYLDSSHHRWVMPEILLQYACSYISDRQVPLINQNFSVSHFFIHLALLPFTFFHNDINKFWGFLFRPKPRYYYEARCSCGLRINFDHLRLFKVHLNLSTRVVFAFAPIKMRPLCPEIRPVTSSLAVQHLNLLGCHSGCLSLISTPD